MNRYGRLARDHWKSTDPGRFSQIQDPDEFFSDLGETAESQIQDLQLHLAGPDPAVPENTLDKVGRLNMARLQAEEVVLADLVWLPPPEDEETLESENKSEVSVQQGHLGSAERGSGHLLGPHPTGLRVRSLAL